MKSKFLKRLILVSSFIALCSAFSCNYLKNVYLLTQGGTNKKKFYTTNSFEFRKGLIIVNGFVNNSLDTSEFIFDTGAFDNKVSIGLFEKLKLNQVAYKLKSDAHGIKKELKMVLLDSLVLGDLSFLNTASGVLEYPENSIAECLAPDGIIGANLIRECCWYIDFQTQQISMAHSINDFKEYTEINNWEVVPFTHPLLSYTPYIDLQVGSEKINNVLFDLGSNGGLDLPISMFKELKHNLDTHIIYEVNAIRSGIFGALPDTVIHAKGNIQIGSIAINNQRVTFSKHTIPKIGTEILKQFNICINNESNQILLQENESKKGKINNPSISFTPYFNTDNSWIVKRVQIGSDAFNNGVKINSIIESINGKKPIDYFTDFCSFISWHDSFWNKQDSVTIVMNSKPLVLKLK